ncbi:MAG: TAXI family TRAP transporter solute-binding subunit [Betaproteobacteria bacterium]
MKIPARLRRATRRDILLTITPAVLIIVAAFALAYQFVKPAPPKKIVMASGQHEGGYNYYAKRYSAFLKRNGVTLEIKESGGAVQNMQLLMEENSNVDVAFIQGGTAFAANAPDLVSLGSLYYEPLWVFYRGKKIISDLDGLKGFKIAIGGDESGTRSLALQLLAMNGTVMPPTQLLPVGGKDAAEQLIAGTIDAALFVSPAASPMIQKLASAPDIHLLSFDRADAYVRRFSYLTKLILPMGVFDFIGNVPNQNVVLLSPTANMIARDTLHPALAYLLMRAATEIHSGSGLLNKSGEFPAALDADFPMSPEAQRYYKTGAPFLQRYLPFWAANLVDRMWVLLVPAIAIMVPLVRMIPPLYRWRIRSRIYRWYARLKEIEVQLEEKPDNARLEEMLTRLDNIDRSVNRIPTPLAYSDNLYIFRQHIDLVRDRVRKAMQPSAPAAT